MNLGEHIIIELYQCDEDSIDSVSFVESSLTEAAQISECKILNKYFHKFSPQGVTGIIAVCESHFFDSYLARTPLLRDRYFLLQRRS